MASGAQAVSKNALSRDEQLRGRHRVREALKALSGDIQVFHNPKLNLAEMGDLYDRPIDIVLLHKTKGILGLAIKSGEIVEETGGLVSQYQPAKQYYKIIDPVKQAQKAVQLLLDECDPAFRDFIPLSVAVAFPDTHQSEFAKPSPLFLFQENLVAADLQQQFEELFLEIWDKDKADKYAANYSKIADYPKSHSDNDIRRVERRETLTKLGVKEEKKAIHLPQSPVKNPSVRAARKPPVTPAPVANIRDIKKQRQPVAAAPQRKIPPQVQQSRSVSKFISNVDNHIKARETVELSSGQWGMLIAVAAIVICLAYFIGRNVHIIMQAS